MKGINNKGITSINSISKSSTKNYCSLKSCNFVSSTPKVGSYAQTSSSNSRPWTKKSINPRKTAKKKKVLYPIFSECAKLTTDKFWQDLFGKASFGKLIRGFTINRDYLIYKRGSKSDSVLIPNSSHEAYSVCVSFFQSTAKIYSDEDVRKMHEEERMMQLQEQLKERTWSKTLKRQKEILIEVYIYELNEKYRLGSEQTKKLEDIINIGILYNHFNKDNIILEDGMITVINGLRYDIETKEFVTDGVMIPKTNKSSSKAKKIEPSPFPKHVQSSNQRKLDFGDEWRKLLEQTTKPAFIKEKKKESETTVKITRVSSPLPFNRYVEEMTEYTLTPTETSPIISTTDS